MHYLPLSASVSLVHPLSFLVHSSRPISGKQFRILAVAFLFQVIFGNETEGRRIYAVPEPGGVRTVVEDMPEVRVSMLAPDFSAGRE